MTLAQIAPSPGPLPLSPPDPIADAQQFAGLYAWASPADRTEFESCLSAALGGCLTGAPPIGKKVSPLGVGLLTGVAIGYLAGRSGLGWAIAGGGFAWRWLANYYG